MPIYCFICDKCGAYTEQPRLMSDASRPQKCECNETMRRCYQAEAPSNTPGNWPMESDAMGVSPTQVVDAEKDAASIGIPTQFNKETGAAIFTSRKHRKQYCEAKGFFDRNGGFSDPQRS